ncbi:MAG TPA: CvpA family protein [Candidatus Scatomorpha intestinavium]|uniref:CvpA family protein n=1 Tax=Candidatus Scatomorpha intestinavium TaxID=2840922 RepID=A0A9D0ZF77_9FIRM|nr:CvpA family protein [Candidatus Scatomorpha intestinavium]
MQFNFGGFGQDPNSGEYSYTPKREQKPRKPRKVLSRGKSLLIALVVTAVFGFLYFYFQLPAINIHSGDFYVFIILLCAVFGACTLLLSGAQASSAREWVTTARKRAAVPFYIVCLCLAVAIVGTVIGWKIFRARDYAGLLPIEDGDFASEVAEISFDQIPMLDSDSANVLATRRLGELADLVSQFEVNPESYQINYHDRPVRVTYLNYGDVFKWWNNQRNGIPAYLVIDMVTQEVSVERLDEGIRYSPSEYFFRDIDRYLRFKYPTKMFSDVNFEVNEEGEPYWVATVVTKRVGLFGGEDAIGAVLVNAVTGESEYLDIEEVPMWVDRVFTAELILEQYNYYGLYHGGFWNSLFGQSGCTESTDYYNYIAQDDDVWLYTGITSVTGDRGNIGFILVNQRTKEARYYPCAGAEESSAMASAMGAVQQYSYQATAPLLLNTGGQPTYFMALKDASQLVKMYAMVNVQQYNIVATGNSVDECVENYEELLVQNGIINGSLPGSAGEASETLAARVEEVRSAVIDGNTVFYLSFEDEEGWFTISAADCPEAAILSPGDRVTVTFSPAEDVLTPLVSLEIE